MSLIHCLDASLPIPCAQCSYSMYLEERSMCQDNLPALTYHDVSSQLRSVNERKFSPVGEGGSGQ